MTTPFGWSSTGTAERDVPVIRLKNDSDLTEKYEFGSKLGQGSFGEVYEATHLETRTKWAIKMVHRPAPGSKMVETVDNEISILKQVNHAHIIHLEAIYNSAAMIYLVTELCKGGDLKQLLQQKKSFTEDETRKIIFSLADAVVYLHQRNIVHRDLKLENILLKNSSNEGDDRFDIKVADFGLSVKTGGVAIGNIMTEACGTLIYMAPEMMSGRGYSQWCDVWSIGVIMFMLLCGEPPFVSQTQRGLLKEIMNKVRFTQPAWASVSGAVCLNSQMGVDLPPEGGPCLSHDCSSAAGDSLDCRTEPVKDWSLVSAEETPESSLDHSCWSGADLGPEAVTERLKKAHNRKSAHSSLTQQDCRPPLRSACSSDHH
nr:serine/threonine-protein kinase 33 isoform X4 [Nothobranchius furzeri]